MLPIYDCGDHLHPSDLGYNAMGDAIDLALFQDGSPFHTRVLPVGGIKEKALGLGFDAVAIGRDRAAEGEQPGDRRRGSRRGSSR